MDPHLYRNTGVAGLGFFFLVAGVIAWLWVGRRRFNRRNIAGIEEFSSYSWMVLTKAVEKVLRVGAVLAVVSGLMLMGRAASSNMSSLASGRSATSASGAAAAKGKPDKRLDRRSPLQPK